MTFDRRKLLLAALGLGASASAAAARVARIDARPALKARRAAASKDRNARVLQPGAPSDQSSVLQALIDEASQGDLPVMLPGGVFIVSDIRLRPGSRLIGASGATVLKFAGGPAFVTGDKADGVVLDGIVFDGDYRATDASRGSGLVSLSRCRDAKISNVDVRNSAGEGVSLIECAGRISQCTIRQIVDAGIKSLDGAGLTVCDNTISDCGNNGILVWRGVAGEDGTIVSGNRISRIGNRRGGSGEYGNGVNVYRADSVVVTGNRITDCAYSAIRGNAASNIVMTSNSCERLGEVAIYSEFGFEGALVANNLVDGAATGISVVNYDHGGRLAVIQGNLIRNLFRREHEAVDKRGEGIGVEADASVTGNTVEGAPTAGIVIGWGPYMRNVAATGNVIRRAKVGIAITDDARAGRCVIANNMISETPEGAIRTMDHGTPNGPDLAREPDANVRISVGGNVAT